MNQLTFTYDELRTMDADDREMLLQIWNNLHPEAPILFESKLERLVPESCPICTEAPNDGLDIGCGHIFCRDCIRSWAQRGGANHDKCPMCRKPYMPVLQQDERFHLKRVLENLTYCLQVFNSVKKWNDNMEDIRTRLDGHFRALNFQNTSAWDTYTAAQMTLVGIRVRNGLSA